MRILSVLFITTTLLLSCSNSATEECAVTGTINNAANKELILQKFTLNGLAPIDTAVIAEDGSFCFGSVEGPAQLYRVELGPQNYLMIVLDSASHITIKANGDNLIEDFEIKGSAESELLAELTLKQYALYSAIDSTKRELQAQQAAKNGAGLQKTLDHQQKLYKDYEDQMVAFINEHPGTIAAFIATTQLDPEKFFDSYEKVAQTLEESHPQFAYTPTLRQQVEQIRMAREKQKHVDIGKEAPELAYPDPDGNIISLSSLRGNYVLVDFWAAWCKPCRMENPVIVKAYKKYHPKGFEIYGVSLDKTKEQWLNAIAEDGITWIQVSDLQYWNSAAAATYGVQSIPANFLLDPNGIIIAKNLRGAELEQKLSEVYNR